MKRVILPLCALLSYLAVMATAKAADSSSSKKSPLVLSMCPHGASSTRRGTRSPASGADRSERVRKIEWRAFVRFIALLDGLSFALYELSS